MLKDEYRVGTLFLFVCSLKRSCYECFMRDAEEQREAADAGKQTSEEDKQSQRGGGCLPSATLPGTGRTERRQLLLIGPIGVIF